MNGRWWWWKFKGNQRYLNWVVGKSFIRNEFIAWKEVEAAAFNQKQWLAKVKPNIDTWKEKLMVSTDSIESKRKTLVSASSTLSSLSFIATFILMKWIETHGLPCSRPTKRSLIFLPCHIEWEAGNMIIWVMNKRPISFLSFASLWQAQSGCCQHFSASAITFIKLINSLEQATLLICFL